MADDRDGRTLADVYAALAAHFPPEVVKTRPGSGGQQLSYVDARDVMDRLDEVAGPHNWWTAYAVLDLPTCAVECRLTVLGITRADVGYPNTSPDKSKSHELLKESYSDALRRVAAQFGIARYLYAGGPARVHQQAQQQQRPQPQQAARPATSAPPPSPTNGTARPAAAAPPPMPDWAEALAEQLNGQPVYLIQGWRCLFYRVEGHPRFSTVDPCPRHNRPFVTAPKPDGSARPLGHTTDNGEPCWASQFN